MPVFSWHTLRILIIVCILGMAALSTWYESTFPRRWVKPLDVLVYPINLTQSPAIDRYIKSLQSSDFQWVEQWLQQQAKRYNVLTPFAIKLTLADPIAVAPPKHSNNYSAWSNIWWSMRMRWWAWWHTPKDGRVWGTARVYLAYHPADTALLPHSLGMERGMIGLVNVRASAAEHNKNLVILTHELLHTVGASDKYNAYGSPVFPIGYAEPQRQPRYPQRMAEIMAGRVAITPQQAYTAFSLRSVVIGPTTAREMGWLTDDENSEPWLSKSPTSRTPIPFWQHHGWPNDIN